MRWFVLHYTRNKWPLKGLMVSQNLCNDVSEFVVVKNSHRLRFHSLLRHLRELYWRGIESCVVCFRCAFCFQPFSDFAFMAVSD